MGNPISLEAVKAGDTVTVFPVASAPRQSVVKRVTKYLIIIDGGDKYSRNFGQLQTEGGYHFGYRRAFIAVGVEAEKAKVTRAAELLRSRASHTMGIPKERLSQETVTSHRKACDEAEAALRQLDEWKT